MTARAWYCIHLPLPAELHDLLIGQLADLGFSGFEQQSDSLECYIRTNRWTPRRVRQFETRLDRFRKEFPAAPQRYRVQRIRERNWNKQWESRAGIVRPTDRFVIQPSWRRLSARDHRKLVLHIDPKMSFGTGHHETTQLSLQLLQDTMFDGASVLDFGTGTGVLAIAAARLNARFVDAVDNDEWSISNATENVRRNDVQRVVRVLHGSVSAVPRRRYDIVVANVDAPTIGRFLPSLSRRVTRRGTLILSGLLESDLAAVRRRARRCGFVLAEYVRRNEWIAALFEPR